MYTKQITGELSFVGVGTNVAGVGFLCLCNGLTLSQTSNSDFSSLSFTPAAALAAFCTQQAEIVDPQEKIFFVAGVQHSGSTLSFTGNDTPEQLQLHIVEDMAFLCFVSVSPERSEAPPVERKRQYRRYRDVFCSAARNYTQRVWRL